MVNIDNLNTNLLEAQYAVRGPIVIKAQELEKKGKKIIYCNIGNPQALKQKPLSYIRQIISLLEYPALLNNSETLKIYPKELITYFRKPREGRSSLNLNIKVLNCLSRKWISRATGFLSV